MTRTICLPVKVVLSGKGDGADAARYFRLPIVDHAKKRGIAFERFHNALKLED